MPICRLLFRTFLVCTSLVVLPVLAAVPLFLPHHYESPTVQAAQKARDKCISQNWPHPYQVATAGPEIICFEGEITAASSKKFLFLPINDGSFVLLHSAGGDVSAALDMADVIHAKHLVVVVDTLCASSCANYLFPAGAAKIVLDGGVVGYHGGPGVDGPITITYTGPHKPTPEETAKLLRLTRETTTKWVTRQAKFFASIGVNADLIYKSPLKRYAAQFKFDSTVWEYGPDTLRKKFGVSNILYFQTPDRQGFLTRARSYLFNFHCKLDSPDVYFCRSWI